MKLISILEKSIKKLSLAGIDNPGLDARVLLKHALNTDDVFLVTHPKAPLTNAQYQKFRRLIRRRKKGEPVAYLVGHKEFYGLDFMVNKNVLVPRPETEMLVDEALKYLDSLVSTRQDTVKNTADCRTMEQWNPTSPFRLRGAGNLTMKQLSILDLGTGSGCIIISLAKKLISYSLQPNFFASDISVKALNVAKRNAKKHGLYDNIRFFVSDLFNNKKLHRKYDLIIANLPYVPFDTASRKLHTANLKFEPKEAIFAADNGAAIIKKFLLKAKNYIASNGIILIELDSRNAKDILSFAKKLYPTAKINLLQDLQGLDRIISIISMG